MARTNVDDLIIAHQTLVDSRSVLHGDNMETQFLRRSNTIRSLQQQDIDNTTTNNNRLSIAATILIPLLLLMVIVLGMIVYYLYQQQQRLQISSTDEDRKNDRHSDGNASDSTEDDSTLIDTPSSSFIGESYTEQNATTADTNDSHKMLTEQLDLPTTQHPPSSVPSLTQQQQNEIVHRRPSYTQTLNTLLQYGNESTESILRLSTTTATATTTDAIEVVTTDDDDDDMSTNGPICIDDGTSYGDDDDDDDNDDHDQQIHPYNIMMAAIRDGAHSPMNEILIFSDVEDDEDDSDNDTVSQYDNNNIESQDHNQKQSALNTTILGRLTTATTTNLLSMLNFENYQYVAEDLDTDDNVLNRSDNASAKPKSRTATNTTGIKRTSMIHSNNDNGSAIHRRRSHRRSHSMSSSSSSIYDDLEEQAWIEFQQQSFDSNHHAPTDMDDTMKIPYKPSNELLVLDDHPNYFSSSNVRRSLDNYNNNIDYRNNFNFMPYDSKQRQRQLWDRIQRIPLSSSSNPLRQKVEL
jgi:hypothetical protein